MKKPLCCFCKKPVRSKDDELFGNLRLKYGEYAHFQCLNQELVKEIESENKRNKS